MLGVDMSRIDVFAWFLIAIVGLPDILTFIRTKMRQLVSDIPEKEFTF